MLEFTVSLVGIDNPAKLENAINVMKEAGATSVEVDRSDAQMLHDPQKNTGIIRAIVFARGDWSRTEIDQFLDRIKSQDVFAET